MKIDHVTIAGSSLSQMETAFANLGLTTDYGGAHSNGITHMSLLGFDDGSYIELISTMEPENKDHAFWGKHIEGDGGPCAWAIYVDNVAAEAARVEKLGVPVDGPHYYTRRRPNGELVEWDLAFLGDKGAGAKLPFIIKDITPRQLRVQPSASVAGQGLTGINTVVLGVREFDQAIALFQRVYGWPSPAITENADFGATLAHFKDTPVTLAAPLPGQPWLAERLARFDESPCAYLIGVDNFEATCRKFKVTAPAEWFKRQVAWFNLGPLKDVKLGIIG